MVVTFYSPVYGVLFLRDWNSTNWPRGDVGLARRTLRETMLARKALRHGLQQV